MRYATVRLLAATPVKKRPVPCPLQLLSRQYATSAPTTTAPAAPRRRRVAKEALPPSLLADTPAPPLQLRDYQEECITTVLEHVAQGHRRMGVSLATGSGKTVVFTQLISRLKHPMRPEEATRTLILAHRTELVDQAVLHCRRSYPDATIEVEMGNKTASGKADITVASLLSIVSKSRIEKFDPASFKLILIDEAHHAVSQTYLQTLDHFGVLNMEQGDPAEKPILVGVSATLSRTDGLALGKVLDHIVYHRDYVEMINEKWLSSVKFSTVRTNVDLSRVSRTGHTGDFKVGDLSLAVNTDTANEVTVRSWMQKARNRKSTLVFCVDIAHVNEITSKFRMFGIDAMPVTSNTTAEDRRARLDDFRNGRFPVLVNCGVFTEGTDIPNIDCVLLARPTMSRNLLIQMIGRGMRLHPSKDDCLIIDMVGNVLRGVITVPTLLGLDPDEILDEESIEQVQARVADKNAASQAAALPPGASTGAPDALPAGPAVPTVSFTDYNSVAELLADERQDRHIRSFSPLSWVFISPDLYVLSTLHTTLKIHRAESEPDQSEGGPYGGDAGSGSNDSRLVPRPSTTYYSVSETVTPPPTKSRKANKHIKSRPRTVVREAPDLRTAVGAADTYLLSKHPWKLMVHNVEWRKAPATEPQLNLLRKQLSEDKLNGMTKGKAMDTITRMKHGGIRRFDEIKKEQKRAEKIEERLRKRSERETVRVGRVAGSTGSALPPIGEHAEAGAGAGAEAGVGRTAASRAESSATA